MAGVIPKGEPSWLRRMKASLRRAGATEVRAIPVRDVVVDERVRLKCQVPLCDSYGRNFTCPPFLPPVFEFREMLSRFERGVLVQVSAEGPFDPRGDVFEHARKLHGLMNRAERMAFREGFRFAAALIGGCCRLCDECAAVRPGEPCRHPFRARPSMEAMGIDVLATLEKAGLEARFPVRDRVDWTGLLLI
jgi:predicted metal-binding protein